MEQLRKLIEESYLLEAIAMNVQIGNSVALLLPQINFFREKYRDWYTYSVTQLSNGLEAKFRTCYETKIRYFLFDPTEVEGIKDDKISWKYPFDKSFQEPITEQRMCLQELFFKVVGSNFSPAIFKLRSYHLDDLLKLFDQSVNLGNLEETEIIGEYILNITSDNQSVRTNTASALYNLSLARFNHIESLNLSPVDPSVSDQCKQLIGKLTKAIELDDEQGFYYWLRGQIFSFLGDSKNAIRNLKIATELEPENGSFFYYLGIAYPYKEGYKEAVNSFSRCIELMPDNQFAYYMRGLVHENHYKLVEARLDFEQALSKGHSGAKKALLELELLEDAEEGNPLHRILKNIRRIEAMAKKIDAVAESLKKRRVEEEIPRPTLTIKDEYDVQDLFSSLFKLYFDDIRREESLPSFGGSKSRVDILLKKEQIFVEFKHTRKGLTAKLLTEELVIDLHNYTNCGHPDCKALVAIIYDRERKISNPNALKRDLEKIQNPIPFKVFIIPE